MSNDSSKTDKQAQSPPKTPNASLYKEITWGPAASVVLVILSYVLAQVGGSLVLLLYPHFQGWDAARTDVWLQQTGAQFAYILLSQSFTLAALGLFLRVRKGTWRSLGLLRPTWRDPLYAALGVVVYFALYLMVVAALQAAVHIDVNQEQDVGFEHVAGAGALVMTFISLVVLPPFVEEVLFRGFLFGGLRRYASPAVAIIGTSALFAMPHLLGSSDGKMLWIAGVDTFVLSVVLCYLREKTGRLWASIGVHAFKNGLAFLTLFILHTR